MAGARATAGKHYAAALPLQSLADVGAETKSAVTFESSPSKKERKGKGKESKEAEESNDVVVIDIGTGALALLRCCTSMQANANLSVPLQARCAWVGTARTAPVS